MDKYAFKDEPLQPLICAELLQQVVPAGKYQRRKILELIQQHHLANGGRPTKASSPGKMIQKALEGLRVLGVVRNAASKGMWEVLPKDEILKIETESFEQEEAEELEDDLDEDDGFVGAAYVYVCFTPAYKRLAELENKVHFHCKIGKADDPDSRIRTLGTGSAERLTKGLAHRSAKAAELESIVKRILTFFGRKVPESGGDEWFFTSPEEVERLIQHVEAAQWMTARSNA